MIRPDDLNIQISCTETMPSLDRLDLQFKAGKVSLYFDGGTLMLDQDDGDIVLDDPEELKELETALHHMLMAWEQGLADQAKMAECEKVMTRTDTGSITDEL